MTLSKPIEQRIFDIYESLSPSERQLADVLLEHQQDIASYTAIELSGKANVSNSTAARLVRRLGYKSFGDARRQIRDAQNWGSPLERVETELNSESAPISMAQSAQFDVINLTRTAENMGAAELDQAVEILRSARRVWLWGVRHGFGLAHLARHYIGFSIPDVQVIPTGATLSDDFASFQAGDALLVFAFRRRPQNLGSLFAEAKKIGVRIIMVADISAARNTRDVDVVLRCWCSSPAIFTSLTAGVAVINYLGWALLEAVGPESIKRLEAMERMIPVTDGVAPAISPRNSKSGSVTNGEDQEM